MFKIIVDSTTDLPVELLEMYDIDVVPLIVNINNVDYKDKTTIKLDEVYDALRKGISPKTSQPNPQDVYDIVIKHAKAGKDIIVFTISSKLSGTNQCINMVCREIQEDYPNIKIEVIDSLGGSAIPGLMAIQAGKLRDQNIPFTEVVEVMNDLAAHSEHIFTVDDLKYLIKSGRINKASAVIGNLLSIKPILHVENGEIKLFKKVHGRNKSLSTLVDIAIERIKHFPEQIIAVMHASSIETAHEVKRMLINKLGETKVIMESIGSALGTHIGIGGVGIMFFNKKPKYYVL